MIYTGVGIMSGTSLDGLDILLCTFNEKGNHVSHEIIDAITIPYNRYWKNQLHDAHLLSGYDLIQLHNTYGIFIGDQVSGFLHEQKIKPEYIASHGHTVFHEPEKRLTFQIGNGAAIAATANLTTISDFRSLDVSLEGQGAPLVPAGDEMLFNEYDYCLNLGGFANISYKHNKQRLAYDICPVNIAINKLAASLDLTMDVNGEIGREGSIDLHLLNSLNDLQFYQMSPPKSLGREWLEKHFMKVIVNSKASIPDKLRTMYEHIAIQLSKNIAKNSKVLITGGGAKNLFLINVLKSQTKANIEIPTERMVDFKEALIFAYLGLLRLQGKPNCLSSVTGARMDNIGGIIYKI